MLLDDARKHAREWNAAHSAAGVDVTVSLDNGGTFQSWTDGPARVIMNFEEQPDFTPQIWVVGRGHVDLRDLTIINPNHARNHMTKTELTKSVAKKSNLTNAAAESAVDALLGTIQGALASGEKVQITGFGTFEVVQRAARTGRNPATGEPIEIPAAKAIKFSPGKALKEAVA